MDNSSDQLLPSRHKYRDVPQTKGGKRGFAGVRIVQDQSCVDDTINGPTLPQDSTDGFLNQLREEQKIKQRSKMQKEQQRVHSPRQKTRVTQKIGDSPTTLSKQGSDFGQLISAIRTGIRRGPCRSSREPKKIPAHWLREGYLQNYKPSLRIQSLARPRCVNRWFKPDKPLNNDLSRPSAAAKRMKTSSYTDALAAPRQITEFYDSPVTESPYKVKRSALTAATSSHTKLLAVPKKEMDVGEKKVKKIPQEWLTNGYLKSYKPSQRIQLLATPRDVSECYCPARPNAVDLSRPTRAALRAKTTSYVDALAEPNTRAAFYSDPCLRRPFSVKKRALQAICSDHVKALATPKKELCICPKRLKKWTRINYEQYETPERIAELALPKDISKYYIPGKPFDANLSRPTRAALRAKTTEYMEALSEYNPKIMFYDNPCTAHPFSVKRRALTAEATERIKVLAQPKVDCFERCDKPKTIPLHWTQSDYLKNYKPPERIVQLASPKDLDQYLIRSKPNDCNLSRPPRAALRAKTTSYYEALAEPNARDQFYMNPAYPYPFSVRKSALKANCPSHIKLLALHKESLPDLHAKKLKPIPRHWMTEDYLKNYRPSDRILALAAPKDFPPCYCPPRHPDLVSTPPRRALLHQTTSYSEALAEPNTREQFYQSPVVEHPYSVKRSALKAHCSERTEALAQPKIDAFCD